MGPDSPPKILIVEDDRMIARYFKTLVERLGYAVCGIAATAEEALRLAREEAPAMIFMDVRLRGGADGIDAALAILQERPVPTVYVTGADDQATLERIRADYPSDVLIKPVFREQIEEVLTRFCPLD